MNPRWIVPVLCVVLGAGGGFGYARLASPSYDSTATVIATEIVQAGAPSDGRRAAQVAMTLGRLSSQTEALAAAGVKVGRTPEQVLDAVQPSVTPDSPVIGIRAVASSGMQAAELANAVADGLVKFNKDNMAATRIMLSVLNVASAPTLPSSPDPLLSVGIGGAAGILLGALSLLTVGGRRARSVAPGPLLGTVGAAAAGRPGEVPRSPTAALPGAIPPTSQPPPPSQGFPPPPGAWPRPPQGPPQRPGPGGGPNNRPGPPPGAPRAPIPPPRQGGRPT